jgi:hypothetical protein
MNLEQMELGYYTQAGYHIPYNEFTRPFIANLIDPLQYFFERYDILECLPYFRECEFDIDTIRRLQRDNIRNLPLDTLVQDDIIQLGEMLREYDIAG